MDAFSDSQRLDWMATHRRHAVCILDTVSGMRWSNSTRVKMSEDFALFKLRAMIDRQIAKEMGDEAR